MDKPIQTENSCKWLPGVEKAGEWELMIMDTGFLFGVMKCYEVR